MNYLIVCPPLVASKDEYYTFPVGLAYIKASLSEVRKSVYGLNLNWKEDAKGILKDYIEQYKIDCVAIGGTSVEYKEIKKLCNYIKNLNPKIIVMIGGGLVTASPELTMKGIENADYGMIGEGEYIIRNLADAIEGKRELQTIKGIVYRDGNTIIKTDSENEIEDLDKLPFPNYEGFDYQEILDAKIYSGITPSNQKNGYATICTSRSCPFNCSFCFHTCGKKYRARSLDNVFKELDYLLSKYQFTNLDIVDELFTANENRVLEFCERIKPFHLHWTCSSRVDTITPRMLQAMKESGSDMPVFGVESANNHILLSMKKCITIEKIEAAFKMAQQAKLPPTGNFLLGDPEETYESFENTVKWFKKHPQYYIHFLKIRILPGSTIYRTAVDKGIIKDELEFYEQGFPYINATKMTDEEYKACDQIIHQAMIERLYLPNESHLINILKKNKEVTLEVTCKQCGSKFEVTHSDLTGSYIFQCDDCGQLYHLPIYLYVKSYFDKGIEDLLFKGKIIIWGIGRVVEKLLYLCEHLKIPNVILVDLDTAKQGMQVYGKTIFAPEQIDPQGIQAILVGATLESAYTSIISSAESIYPQVKDIKTLADFTFDCLKDEEEIVETPMRIQGDCI